MARVIWAHRRLVVVTCAATLVVLSTLALIAARAQPGGGDPPGFEVYREIHRLRVEVHDYPAARALAERFLTRHPEHDLLRQAVEFEYAAVFYAEQNWATAMPLFETVVETYLEAGFDEQGEFFLVDDAQFFIGAVRQRTGDPEGAITAYQFLLDRFPTSNRHASGMVRLASVYQSLGQVQTALGWFQQVVAQHPEADIAPEAQLHVGNCYRTLEQYEDAVAAYQVVEQRWPDSKFVPNSHLETGFAFMRQGAFPQASAAFVSIADEWPQSAVAPDGLQHANRALIHQELEDWKPQGGVWPESGIDNSAAIDSNLARLTAAYPNSASAIDALLDAVNYYSKRTWWNSAACTAARSRIPVIVSVMTTLAPEARQTIRAGIDLAIWTRDEDPQTALALVDHAIREAQLRQDEGLYLDASFNKGTFTREMGQPTEARAIWQEMLQHQLDPLFEGEVRTNIGFTYMDEADNQTALDIFATLAGDARYDESVRSSTHALQAHALFELGRTQEALIALDEMLALYPHSLSAPAAQRFREFIVSLPPSGQP